MSIEKTASNMLTVRLGSQSVASYVVRTTREDMPWAIAFVDITPEQFAELQIDRSHEKTQQFYFDQLDRGKIVVELGFENREILFKIKRQLEIIEQQFLLMEQDDHGDDAID